MIIYAKMGSYEIQIHMYFSLAFFGFKVAAMKYLY